MKFSRKSSRSRKGTASDISQPGEAAHEKRTKHYLDNFLVTGGGGPAATLI
jgi:hypothetical protein